MSRIELSQTLYKQIAEYLGVLDPRKEKKEWGWIIEKGNTALAKGVDKVVFGTKALSLSDRVFHERVLVIREGQEIGIRSHQEQSSEYVINIGKSPITRLLPRGATRDLLPNRGNFSHTGTAGFDHGWRVQQGTGILYIAKALKLEYVEGDSFKIPENTYKEQ